MNEAAERTLGPERLLTRLSGIFGILAALLASFGIYGIMSYSVAQRTWEVGIRMALGAQRGNVLLADSPGDVSLALIGVVIGVPAAIGASRLPFEPPSAWGSPRRAGLGLRAALMLVVAASPATGSARRATKVDPMVSPRRIVRLPSSPVARPPAPGPGLIWAGPAPGATAVELPAAPGIRPPLPRRSNLRQRPASSGPRPNQETCRPNRTKMRSCLLRMPGVMHHRFRPPGARVCLPDLFSSPSIWDELETLPGRLGLFSVNRANLHSLREGDYLPTREKRCIGRARRKPPWRPPPRPPPSRPGSPPTWRRAGIDLARADGSSS